MRKQDKHTEDDPCRKDSNCDCIYLKKVRHMEEELHFLHCERMEMLDYIRNLEHSLYEHIHQKEIEVKDLNREIKKLKGEMIHNPNDQSSKLQNISLIVRGSYEGKDPIHECDVDIPVSSFRTTSLFHYTKEFFSLKKILEDGLIPNFCSEDLLPSVTIGIPMVSFCDIPLSRTHFHTIQYGSYAIGLATEYGEQNNINPLFYVATPTLMEIILKWPYDRINIEGLFKNPVCGLYKKMYGDFDGKEIKNYAENEWRYVVPHSRSVQWMKSIDEYRKWRGSGVDGKKPNPINNPALYDARLKFNVKDVNYIIVEKEWEVKQMAEYILRLNSIGASEEQLTEADKIYLITRIISFERIRRDF